MIEGSIHLNNLPVVVLDLETTGLNIMNDRIIQIGAVKMEGKKLLPKHSIDQLVNPQIKITQKNSEIHGITNSMVEDKPTYKEQHKMLNDFIKDQVIYGYNIGFDLAMIRRETVRSGFPVEEYRYLDLKFLAMLIDLPDDNMQLDSLAQYFKVDLKNRHQAYADCIITGKVFAAMIPLLVKQGITTLSIAEKESYKQMMSYNTNLSQDTGWYYPRPKGVPEIQIKERSWNMLERIDPFPFSHTVEEIMISKLITTSENTPINKVVDVLAEKSIASILITNKKSDVVGIISERDIIRYFSAQSKKKSSKTKVTAGDLMTSPLITIIKSAFLYQAIEMLEIGHIRHLPVSNEQGKVVGIISNRDLNRKRITNFYRNQTRLQKAKNSDDLHEIFLQIPVLARRLLKEEVSTKRIANVISNECIALTRKATVLAEQEMKKRTGLAPPCEYSVMILGSAGRGESLLSFDQDNAIIYCDYDKCKKDLPKKIKSAEELKNWFLEMGGILNDILHQAGVPLCKGGVMAGKEEWCRSESDWQERVYRWFETSSSKAILNADIFLDLKWVHGSNQLFNQLQKFTYQTGMKSTTFLKLMGENLITSVRSPLNFWGNIKTVNNWVDMKLHILFPVVALSRLFALKIGYFQTNDTFHRLEKAKYSLKLNQYEVDIFQEIQSTVFTFILNQQLKNLDLGEDTNNKVFLPDFNKRKIEKLKKLLPTLNIVNGLVHSALLR